MIRERTAVGAAVTIVVISLLGSSVGISTANHGVADNFTVSPATVEDRQPGIDNASYKTWSSPSNDAGFRGFKYLNYTVLIWEAGTLGNCGTAETKVFAVDRGSDDPGTEFDDRATDNIENFHQSENKVVVDFIDPGDPVAEPLHFNVTDEFVTYVKDCRGNPDSRGWYQLTAKANGTTWGGAHIERTTKSHYFWICDCETEQEAREKLGPPPSETPTATSTGTETPIPSPTATQTATRTTTDPDASPESPTPTATPTVTDTITAKTTTGSTPTKTPAEWASTSTDGPGFGILAIAFALIIFVVLRII